MKIPLLKNQYCVFSLGAEEYAIPIDTVKEVVKFSKPAPIPQMPKLYPWYVPM